jgi:hypothetical protein
MLYNILLAESLDQHFDEGRHSIYNWMPGKFGDNPCSGYLLKSWQEAALENNRLMLRHQRWKAFKSGLFYGALLVP